LRCRFFLIATIASNESQMLLAVAAGPDREPNGDDSARSQTLRGEGIIVASFCTRLPRRARLRAVVAFLYAAGSACTSCYRAQDRVSLILTDDGRAWHLAQTSLRDARDLVIQIRTCAGRFARPRCRGGPDRYNKHKYPSGFSWFATGKWVLPGPLPLYILQRVPFSDHRARIRGVHPDENFVPLLYFSANFCRQFRAVARGRPGYRFCAGRRFAGQQQQLTATGEIDFANRTCMSSPWPLRVPQRSRSSGHQ